MLTARGMENFYSIFKDWENQDKKHYKSMWPDSPFSNRPNAADPAYAETLQSVSARLPDLGVLIDDISSVFLVSISQ